MNKEIYIIDYTEGRRTVHGPFETIHVMAIHTTVPHVCDDTISFYTSNGDTASVLTVSMVHTITSDPEKEETT